MAWEKIERRSAGRGAQYGRDWAVLPAIAVAKHTLTINPAFMAAYGLKSGDSLQVMVDREKKKVGLQHIAAGEEDIMCFQIRYPSKKSSTKQCVVLGCKRVAQIFPDCQRRAFRAQLNPGCRVIEVSLDAANEIR